MSRILYVWELGAGYGHIAPFYSIAKQLKQRGHEVIFVLKNLEYADAFLSKEQFHYLQAPMRWPNSQTMPAAFSYPGILKNAGFDEPGALFSRAKAWLSLYEYLQPDLILFDHSPTALLAARGLDVPKALFGSGFYAPPQISPLPTLRPWLKVDEKELMKVESQVLEVANSVLQRFDCQPLGILADLFKADENFLCTFSELDHYQKRHDAHYWGPTFYQADGLKPQWPSVGDRKIFAYLNRDYPGLETLLKQLRSTSYSILIHIAGITPAFIQKHSGANMHISPQPYHMPDVCQQSDMAISYGSAGTLAAFLLSGKPLLVLPYHLEQLLNAHNVAALGAGLYLNAENKKPNYRSLIAEILSNPKYRQAAEAFSKKYADFSPERQATEISKRCEALILNDKHQ